MPSCEPDPLFVFTFIPFSFSPFFTAFSFTHWLETIYPGILISACQSANIHAIKLGLRRLSPSSHLALCSAQARAFSKLPRQDQRLERLSRPASIYGSSLRNPWPYIKMSDSEDDKPLMKGMLDSKLSGLTCDLDPYQHLTRLPVPDTPSRSLYLFHFLSE